MSVHDVDEVHRCQRYAYEVGLPLHVPFDTVSVWPTFGVPETAGAVRLPGAAAKALAARRSPATIVASSAGMICFLIRACSFVVGTRVVFPRRRWSTTALAERLRVLTGC